VTGSLFNTKISIFKILLLMTLLQVTVMASYFEPLAEGAVGTASLVTNSKQQTQILDLTKTVAESALQFMYSCKDGGGNPKVSYFYVECQQIV